MNDEIVNGLMTRGLVLKVLGGALPETRQAIAKHDLAQREALARVEAERDRWIGHYNHLMEQYMPRTGDGCEKGWSRVAEARELQTQLAEAVALLQEIEQRMYGEDVEHRFTDLIADIDRITAQVEQQGYCERCGCSGEISEGCGPAGCSCRGEKEAQAQLAEAVGLLRDAMEDFRIGPTYGWEDRLARRFENFLARYSQAEQKEAPQSDPEQSALGRYAVHASGEARLKIESPAAGLQEAQCAQAGDERAAFEHWASDGGLYPNAVERRGDQYKLAQTHSYWQAWQARASLCIKNGESKS